METLGKTVAAILIIIGLLFIAIPYYGWAIATLWEWFVVPLGMPSLSWPHAYGLSVLIGFVTIITPHETKGETLRQLILFFLKPVAAVFFGWVARFFM